MMLANNLLERYKISNMKTTYTLSYLFYFFALSGAYLQLSIRRLKSAKLFVELQQTSSSLIKLLS